VARLGEEEGGPGLNPERARFREHLLDGKKVGRIVHGPQRLEAGDLELGIDLLWILDERLDDEVDIFGLASLGQNVDGRDAELRRGFTENDFLQRGESVGAAGDFRLTAVGEENQRRGGKPAPFGKLGERLADLLQLVEEVVGILELGAQSLDGIPDIRHGSIFELGESIVKARRGGTAEAGGGGQGRIIPEAQSGYCYKRLDEMHLGSRLGGC
jgi:hypothetical protein